MLKRFRLKNKIYHQFKSKFKKWMIKSNNNKKILTI